MVDSVTTKKPVTIVSVRRVTLETIVSMVSVGLIWLTSIKLDI